jgi:hypothetical protein
MQRLQRRRTLPLLLPLLAWAQTAAVALAVATGGQAPALLLRARLLQLRRMCWSPTLSETALVMRVLLT